MISYGIHLFLFTSLSIIILGPSMLLQMAIFHSVFWGASLAAQMVKNLPAMWETWVQALCWEEPLEKEMATHCNILAWRIPWQRSLAGHSPWGHKESDTTEAVWHSTWPSSSLYSLNLECPTLTMVSRLPSMTLGVLSSSFFTLLCLQLLLSIYILPFYYLPGVWPWLQALFQLV